MTILNSQTDLTYVHHMHIHRIQYTDRIGLGGHYTYWQIVGNLVGCSVLNYCFGCCSIINVLYDDLMMHKCCSKRINSTKPGHSAPNGISIQLMNERGKEICFFFWKSSARWISILFLAFVHPSESGLFQIQWIQTQRDRDREREAKEKETL